MHARAACSTSTRSGRRRRRRRRHRAATSTRQRGLLRLRARDAERSRSAPSAPRVARVQRRADGPVGDRHLHRVGQPSASGTATRADHHHGGAGRDPVTVTGETNGFYDLEQELHHDQRLHRHRDDRRRHLRRQNSSNITVSATTSAYAGQPVSGQTNPGSTRATSRDSLVVGNTIDHNTDYGIYLERLDRATVVGQRVFGNAQGYQRAASGIRLYDSTGQHDRPQRVARQRGLRDRALHGREQQPRHRQRQLRQRRPRHRQLQRRPARRSSATPSTTTSRPASTSRAARPGATIANNISVDNGVTSPRTHSDIRVDNASTAGHDDGLRPRVPDHPGPLFIWNSRQLLDARGVPDRDAARRSTASQADPRGEPGRARLPSHRRLAGDRLGELRRDRAAGRRRRGEQPRRRPAHARHRRRARAPTTTVGRTSSRP